MFSYPQLHRLRIKLFIAAIYKMISGTPIKSEASDKFRECITYQTTRIFYGFGSLSEVSNQTQIFTNDGTQKCDDGMIRL